MANAINPNNNPLIEAINRLRQSLAGLTGAGGNYFQNARNNFSNPSLNFKNIASTAFQNFLKGLEPDIKALGDELKGLKDKIASASGSFKKFIDTKASPISSGISSATATVSDLAKNLLKGIKAKQSQSPQPGIHPVKAIAGTVAGGVFSRIASKSLDFIPGSQGLKQDIAGASEFFRNFRNLGKQAREFATSSPLGRSGLDRLREFSRSPFLSEGQREFLGSRISTAQWESRRAENLKKASDAAKSKSEAAAADHRKAIDQRDSALQNFNRRSAQERRYYKARASLWQKYRSQLYQHINSGQSSPYAPYVAAAKARYNKAKAASVAATRRTRNARQAHAAAVSNVSKTYTAFRNAAKSAGVARAAYGAASMTARNAASAAQNAAAAIASRASLTALGVVAGSAAGALSKLYLSVFAARGAMKSFAESTLENNRYLQGYSGALSQAYARLESSNIQRRFAVAGGTEKTGVMLVEAINRMRDNQVQLNISLSNIANSFGSLAANAVGGFDKEFGKFAASIDRLVQGFGVGKPGGIAEVFGEVAGKALLGPLTWFFEKAADLFGLANLKNNPPQVGDVDVFAQKMAEAAAQRGAEVRKKNPNRLPGFGG